MSSAAAAAELLQLAAYRRRLERDTHVVHLRQRVGIDLIVGPAPVFPVGDQSGVFQHAKMEGEPRLRGIEVVGELAHAALAAAKLLEDLEARFVGERVKEHGGAGEIGAMHRCGHGSMIHQCFLMRQEGRRATRFASSTVPAEARSTHPARRAAPGATSLR